MADVTDTNAISWANGRFRPLCDALPAIYTFCKREVSFFNLTDGLATAFPNDPTALVQDGSPTDGRRQYTAAEVFLIMGLLTNICAALEANDNAGIKAVNKVAVNPQTMTTVQ